MVCKKCLTTYSDDLKACPKCATPKESTQVKKFKVQLPSSAYSPQEEQEKPVTIDAPKINKVTSKSKNNSQISSNYIDKEVEELPDIVQLQIEQSKREIQAKLELAKEQAENKSKVEEIKIEKNLNEEIQDEEISTEEIENQDEIEIVLDEDAVDESNENEPISLEQDNEEDVSEIEDIGETETQEQKTEKKKAQKKVLISHQEKLKLDREEKRSLSYIYISVAALFIIMCILTTISMHTGVFEKDTSKVSTIGFMSLSKEETDEVATYLDKIHPIIIGGEYNKDQCSPFDILDLVSPASEFGLYSTFFGKAQALSDSNDPFQIFIDEGEKYYKIKKAEINQILAYFGFESVDLVFEEKYYQYEDFYYFSTDILEEQEEISIQITKTRSTKQGGYYAEIEVYSEDSSEAMTKKYVVMEKLVTSQDISFFLSKVSDNEIYTSLGELVESEENIASYTMKEERITTVTSDGTVVYESIINYPIFDSKEQPFAQINQIYLDLINSYKLSEKTAKQEYNSYIKNGASKADFPIKTQIIVEPILIDDEYISILTHSIEQDILLKGEEQAFVPSYNNSFSSNNYVIDGGYELDINEILGDDEDKITELLYRVFSGYDYDTVLDGSYLDEDDDTIEEDVQGIGRAIYDSSFVMTENSIILIYQDAIGKITNVEISNEVIEKLK